MKAIMNDEVMKRLIDTLMELQKKESTDLPLLKKQLAETEKGINNMLNAIQTGIFTPSTKQRLDELEKTKSQLEVSILQEEMHKPLLTREQIAFFIYRFRKFDVTKREQRQRLIDSFVNAVYLYEDKIILTFNYKDGSKTITLADVEGSDLSSFGALFFALRIKNWSGGPIRIALMGSVKTFRQGIFIFPEKKIIPTGHFMPNTHFKSIPEKKFP